MTQETQAKPEQPIQTQPAIKEPEPTAAEKKTSWQAERKALNERLERLEAKLAQPSNAQSPSPNVASPQQAPAQNLTEDHSDHDHASGKPHYVGPWQKYCPSCGDVNPEFKDEVVCDGCGGNLGAVETASKLRACPNCGGKKAHKRKN